MRIYTGWLAFGESVRVMLLVTKYSVNPVLAFLAIFAVYYKKSSCCDPFVEYWLNGSEYTLE